jgi:outer membrane murein-binding lipoprotein Lpp
LLVAGCDSSRPAYFVGADGSTVALIKWSASQAGRATGSLTEDTLSGTAPAQTVNVQSVPVTVTRKGSDVFFAGTGLDALAGATIMGRLSGGTLRITARDTSGYLKSAVFRSATSAAYNSDVASLRRHASRDNAAAKRVQPRQQNSAAITSDQQQVSSDVSTLQADAATLTSDMSQMSTDAQQVSTDLVQLKSDAANGQGQSCDNVATVDSDASTVDADGTTVGNDSTTVTSDVSTVQSDISQLNTDLATLAKDGGSAVGGQSPLTVISQEQAGITGAVSQANSYITTVNGYLQQAYTTANDLAGSNCGGSA